MKIWRLGSVALHCLTCATWHDGNGGDPMAWPCTAPRACCTRGLQDGARALVVEGPKGFATREHPGCEIIGSGPYRRVLVAPTARTRTHPVRQKTGSWHHRRVLAVHPRRGPALRARRKLRPARQRRIHCVGAAQARGRWNACTARRLGTCSRRLLWKSSRGIAQRVSAARGLARSA